MLRLFIKSKPEYVYEAVDADRINRLDQAAIARSFARAFSSEDGKTELAYLQATTFNRALNAEASNEQIRFAEGQRALLGLIIRQIEKGKSGQ